MRKKDRNNNLTEYVYDGAGRKVVEIRGIAGPGSRNPEHREYDGWTYLSGSDKVASFRHGAAFLDPATPSLWQGGTLTTYDHDYRGRQVGRSVQANQARPR